jgi:hypothetical protein
LQASSVFLAKTGSKARLVCKAALTLRAVLQASSVFLAKWLEFMGG